MESWYERTEQLLGTEGIEKLAGARVAVFGVGGVGGYVVEALARCGVGALDLIDNDVVSPSNLNRQVIATVSTLGKAKVEAARDRIGEINPDCRVTVHKVFYLPETAEGFDFKEYDYVVDAIDTVSGKLMLAEQARAAGTPIISAMGAGNKLDPTAFRVANIYETKVCPLARVMRRELRKRGIDSLKVVYSEEEPRSTEGPPGSVSFVPSVAGLILAGEVVKDLLRQAESPGAGSLEAEAFEQQEENKRRMYGNVSDN